MSSSYPPAEPAVMPGDLDKDGEMSPESRRELDAIIAESEAEIARGEGISLEQALAEIRHDEQVLE
jgi:hypothetical protein